MKLVFIELDFWTHNETLIEKLVQTAGESHDVFRSLMEAEYANDAIAESVEFDCSVANLVNSYNHLAIDGLSPTTVVIQFDN